MSDYVTVVSVDLQPTVVADSVQYQQATKSSFVTVLSVNSNENTTTIISTSENPNDGEIVTVYRLPGERLGFGLKFRGGNKTNEKVQRLFIQSCDTESPASKARASWGSLGEGDEILRIDGEPVSNMTRIECVKRLKDSNVAINLLVKKKDINSNRTIKNGFDTIVSKKRPLPPPPPIVPPRKINKKPPTRETNLALVSQRNIALEIQTPVAAETYLNTLDDEINRNDESDETGSTISSQISVISNFSSESDLSLMSSIASSNDLTKILTKPFQMIEREFNVNSYNVLTSETPMSMSIDNLLLFNDLAPTIEIDDDDKVKIDIKPSNTYVNFDVNNAVDDQRQYENIDIKLPPIPRPRSISLPQDTGEIDTKTPSKNIELWLNGANTISDDHSIDENRVLSHDDREQDYDAIKFECFAAGDDEDDEKLGPPELLNISEAYFNFSWCGNSPNNLPTIGEAEEEFSSLEPVGQNPGAHKVHKGPIFIVHSVLDKESDSDGKNEINKNDCCLISERVDMEINNNSLYLHECEDKGDNNDKRMQCENNISQSVKAAKDGFSSEKLIANSLKETIDIETMRVSETTSLKEENVESNQSKTEVTNPPDTVVKVPEELDDKCAENEMIKNDSERLESQYDDEAIKIENEKPVPLIKEQIVEITQVKSPSEDMISLPTQSTYEFSLDAEMLPDRIEARCSWMPSDGQESSTSRMFSSNAEKDTKSDSTRSNSVKSSPTLTTKATAIVAPFVSRKTHQFDEIKNRIETKAPSKSATLSGHQRSFFLRNKDEKSEKSVKDKIAMFSSSTSDISQVQPITQTKHKFTSSSLHRNGSVAKSTENIFSSSDSNTKSRLNKKIQNKSMSEENLDNYDDFKLRDKRDIQLNYKPVSNSARLQSPGTSKPHLTLKINKAQSIQNLNEPYESPSRPSLPSSTAPALSRRISFSGYSNSQMKENRQKSITNILENRKKSMSKLRGLVIPEKVPENEAQWGEKVLGLPVIRSKECDLINGSNMFHRSVSMPQQNDVPTNSFNEKNSENRSMVKAVPRRSISELKYESQILKSPPVKPPRTSLTISSNNKSTTTDESDTESCLSSRIPTPPFSPIAKKPLARTFSSETNTSVSSNSTLVSGSGSQASCSSSSSTPESRVNKSTEALSSRKSILASSKSRSGRETLDKSWRDEDSTDGGIENDDRKRAPKAKARGSLVNYRLVSPNEHIVDKIINVATYNEVVTSDSDEKAEATEAISCTPVVKYNPSKPVSNKEVSEFNLMSDMVKWVRREATKSTVIIKKEETVARVTPKVLEPPKKLSLSEIRKNFEKKSASVVAPQAQKSSKEKSTASHDRFSSWDSVASSSSGVSSELLGTGTGTNNSESLQTLQSDFGSFSSYGSSHSLITPQDLQLIIDEADPPLETQEAFVVVLQRETPESSIGITLAGGSDYEAKEITIHRILTNSPADRDGRLKRGDRLLSINGLSMRGLTHRESLSVLKSPRVDVVMVVTRSKSVIKTNSLTKTNRGSLGSLTSLTEKKDSEADGTSKENTLHASAAMDMDLYEIRNEECSYVKKSYRNGHSTKPAHDFKDNDIHSIKIVKDGAGLGFSIDGGYDSPSGNMPLIVKKIFMGGAAERIANLKVGDEITEINGRSIGKQTRIDVWNMIKNLPQGTAVQLTVKRK